MKHLRIDTGRPNDDDSLECDLYEDGCIRIEIDNPWSGDSISGFGKTASICLTKDEATQLRDFLSKMIDIRT